MSEPVLTLINPGRKIEHKGRRPWGHARTFTIGREWEVTLDGETIGYIRYRMMTRETRSPGKRYVNSRWESPGWDSRRDRFDRGLEADTKQRAIERLVHDARATPPKPPTGRTRPEKGTKA